MRLTEAEIIDIVKANFHVPKWVGEAREMSTELLALVKGDGFQDLLAKIEHVESDKRNEARKKYSRDIRDVFERILSHVDNIFSSYGGSDLLKIDNDSDKELIQTHVGDVRGGLSLRSWIENNWLDLYNIDPSGVVFLEYDFVKEIKPYPTIKSINTIRNYLSDGQSLDWILFEPVNVDGDQHWRFVDGEKDYKIISKNKQVAIVENETFPHGFGKVPAFINSGIPKIGKEYKLSPINSIVELSKEYARDRSIKTLFKFLQGFPLFWKYAQTCPTCNGAKKVDNSDGSGHSDCPSCGGGGYVRRNDITDEIVLSIPDGDDVKIAPDLAGFVVPPLEIWEKYNDELELLECMMEVTLWGAKVDVTKTMTATEVVSNHQPIIKRLNKYADAEERLENFLIDLISNQLIPSKDKKEKVSFNALGRRFIIDSEDALLERYHTAKLNGDNNTILDFLYEEYLLSKYKSNPAELEIAINKSKVEPYLHTSTKDVFDTCGEKEAKRKAIFPDWWKIQENKEKDFNILLEDYKVWFEKVYNERFKEAEVKQEVKL